MIDQNDDSDTSAGSGFPHRLRNYFLTGLVVAAPIGLTAYFSFWVVQTVDRWVEPLLPEKYNPDTYLPFHLPGIGLVTVILGLTVLGFLTANLFGRSLLTLGERVVNRMPVVRNIYNALKQIFETVVSQRGSAFRTVGLVEYPRKGVWAIAFISADARGEVQKKAAGDEDDLLSVFLPTTPNPTSGYLIFLPRKDVILLDMSVEQAAKLVISAGLVMPENNAGTPGKDPA